MGCSVSGPIPNVFVPDRLVAKITYGGPSRRVVHLYRSWERNELDKETKAKMDFLDKNITLPALNNAICLRSIFLQFGDAMKDALPDTVSKTVPIPLFKSQMFVDWMYSFNDASEGTTKPKVLPDQQFCSHLSDLLKCKNRGTRNATSAEGFPDTTTGLMCISGANLDPFVPLANADIDSEDDHSQASYGSAGSMWSADSSGIGEETRFKRQMLDIVYGLMSNCSKNKPLMTALKDKGLCVDIIATYKFRIAAASMSILMRAEACHLPVFVGGESVGKTTLINVLIDPASPSAKGALPTGTDMVTQHVAVVKHSNTHEVILGDGEPSKGEVADLLKFAGKERSKLRAKDQLDLGSSVAFVKTPFKSKLRCLVDVPGIKPSTELETMLALGMCSCVVIVAPALDKFKSQLENGDLKRLREIYEQLRGDTQRRCKRPPIICAVTKAVTQAEFDTCQEDQHDNYDTVLNTYFPSCDVRNVVYANSFDPGFIKDDLANNFAQMLECCPVSSTWESAYEIAFPGISHFLETIEQVFKDNEGNFESSFSDACKATRTKLDKLQESLGSHASGKWIPEVDPEEYLGKFHSKEVRKAVFVRHTGAMGISDVTTINKPYIMDEALQEYRVSVMRVIYEMSRAVHNQLWKNWQPFLQPLLIDRGCKRERLDKESKNGSELKTWQKGTNTLTKNLETLLGNKVTEMVYEAVDCMNFQIPDKDDIDNFETYRVEWCKLAASGVQLCTNPDSFPWMLIGHYSSLLDETFEKVFLSGVGVSLTEEDDIGPPSICGFPNCINESWGDFLKLAQKCVTQLQDARYKKKLLANEMHTLQINCVHECVDHCIDKITSSNLFKVRNPLTSRLVCMAFNMVVKLIVTYKATKDGGDLDFTKFGEELRTYPGAQDQIEPILQDLRESRHDSALMRLDDLQIIFKEEVELTGRHKNTIRERLGRVKKQHQKFKRIQHVVNQGQPSNDVMYFCFMSGDREAVLNEVGVHFSVNMPELKSNSADLVQSWALPKVKEELTALQPRVVCFVRRHDVFSATPTDVEFELLEHIKNMSGVGGVLICWSEVCTEASVSVWQKKVGVPLRFHLVKAVVLSPESWCIDKECMEPLVIQLNRLRDEAPTVISDNWQSSVDELQGVKAQLIDNLTAYLRHKKSQIVPQEFHSKMVGKIGMPDAYVKEMTDLSLEDLGGDIQVPVKELFMHPPFRATAMGDEGKIELNELVMRTFIHKTIMPQLIAKAMQIADHIWDSAVEMILQDTADEFGLAKGVITNQIIEFAKREQSARSSKGADVDIFPALFLQKKNFRNMYIGGTVMAACPMIISMITATFADTERDTFTMDKIETLVTACAQHAADLQTTIHLHKKVENRRRSVG